MSENITRYTNPEAGRLARKIIDFVWWKNDIPSLVLYTAVIVGTGIASVAIIGEGLAFLPTLIPALVVGIGHLIYNKNTLSIPDEGDSHLNAALDAKKKIYGLNEYVLPLMQNIYNHAKDDQAHPRTRWGSRCSTGECSERVDALKELQSVVPPKIIDRSDIEAVKSFVEGHRWVAEIEAGARD